MVQLLAHMAFAIALYREHKFFFTQWSGWYVFLSGWTMIFLASVSFLNAVYVIYWRHFEAGPLLFIFLCTLPILIIYGYVAIILMATFYEFVDEPWWARTYAYCGYLVGYGFQCVWYKNIIKSQFYFLVWYIYQCQPRGIKLSFIPTIFLLVIFLRLYIYAFFNSCLMYPYSYYFVTVYYSVVDLCEVNFIFFIVIYVIFKLVIFWIFINFLFFNKNMRFMGIMNLDETYLRRLRVDDKLGRFDDRFYIEFLSNIYIGRGVYEYPINWLSSSQFNNDSYNSVLKYFRYGYIHILLLYIYNRYDVVYGVYRRRDEFCLRYISWYLDQDWMYG